MKKNGHAIIRSITDALDVVGFFAFALVFAALLVVGCGAADEPPRDEPVDPIPSLYGAAQDRLVGMLDGGYVVSRWQDGRPEHIGDSLIWSGLAMFALDCEHGAAIEDALLAMVGELDGGLWRHPMRPGDVSMDGAVGFYRGVAWRVDNCEGSADKWRVAFAKHQAFSEPGGKLNPSANATLPKEFTYVRDLLAHKLGSAGRPHSDRLRALEGQIVAWATAVKQTKAACYRIHLGYQTLKTLHQLGADVSATGKELFCKTTADTDLPTVDHYCGRRDLGAWIDSFTWNTWEHRHQRCPAWESPDGKDGLATPGLDLVEALKEKYAL